MRQLEEIKTILQHHKSFLNMRYNVKEVGIFGSYARGTATEESDLDILVQFERPIGLDFVALAEELEAILQMKVDLVSLNAIKPKMLKHVMENVIYV